ncbi:hypothetical protein C1645_817232 [Glomus cerebriforme]|uniref:Uncharacterized protein n=1 Tax=Glomus cerebriforme TaxID=658196 RepID=A0A397TJF7_9GLOM|nr:hypothetical protein C1645_817232 [Glomus cerebriforme]
MVVNDSSEATAGNGKQPEASVLLTSTLSSQPVNNGLKEEFVGNISDSEKSTTASPQSNFWNIHDTLELKNNRKSGIPHSLDLPPTPTLPTFLPSPYCDNNSPTSSPCLSSYFDIYQPLNSCPSISSSESNSSNSNSPIDSPDTPPLSPSIIESPRSPKSPDSVFSSSSLPLVSALSNSEQRRTPRQVSFNHTVTFIPHIPPPPNKIRKKLTKEAGARQKDLVLEVEDLGKVRLDGKNGRVIKIIPNVFPGPLNGEYGQCDVMLKDVTMEISSKDQIDNNEEKDDDVLYITAVPIVEKDKKLRLGKHFKRYYNKLVQ